MFLETSPCPDTKSSSRSVFHGLVYWVIEPSTTKRHAKTAKNSRPCCNRLLCHRSFTAGHKSGIPMNSLLWRKSEAFSRFFLREARIIYCLACGMTLFGNVETCPALLRLGLHLRVPDTRSSQRLHQAIQGTIRAAGKILMSSWLGVQVLPYGPHWKEICVIGFMS